MSEVLLLNAMDFSSALMAAYFWIRKNLWQSVKTMLELSVPQSGQNAQAIRDYASQKSDSVIAFALIVLGALARLGLFHVPHPISSFAPAKVPQLVLIIGVCGFEYFIGNLGSRSIQAKILRRAQVPKIVR